MTTRDWQDFAISGDMKKALIMLLNGVMTEWIEKVDSLYNLVAFVRASYHWMNGGGSCECDDHSRSVSPGDFWKVYVR